MFSRAKANALLLASLLLASTAATAAPVAASFKSVLNVTSVIPGSANCGTGSMSLSVSGSGLDTFGPFTFTESVCARSATFQFTGSFRVVHSSADVFFGNFNGTFIPSGEILEVHSTWRISGGKGQFAQLTGAGTGKGLGTVVNGGPGPAKIFLDGSIFGAP
jgi:hypothetical protein